MKKGKVLVNGAGGFLGSHTVEAFVEAGYAVRATDLPGMPLDWARQLGVEVMPADLTDFTQAHRVLEGVAGVVNVAGLYDFSASYDNLYKVNVELTENMCRAALEADVRKFVHIATIGVYGLPAYTPMDEGGPKRPKNDYELTKKLGEDIVFDYQRTKGLRATSLRPGPIYGPRSRYIHSLAFATMTLMATAEKQSGPMFDDGVYCHHVHVRDVARAAVLLMQLPRTIGQAYNVCDQTPIKWNRLWDVIAECVGYQPEKRMRWIHPVMRVLLPIALKLYPQSRLDRDNEKLAQAWRERVEEYDLEPALVPRLDKDMFAYMLADHVYDISGIRDLGFEWAYPDTATGLRDNYRWLVEQRWIPELPQVGGRAAA